MMHKKELMSSIIKNMSIIVATSEKATNSELLNLKFKRVLIYDA